MSSSRIEQIIEEIEEYVDGCKYQPLSSTKIVVNKEELEEMLRELRLKTPDEIKRYQKIISNKDAILTDAQEKADGILAEAEARAQEMVTQTEIMKQAYVQASDTVNAANQQAQGILDSAQRDANNIRMSAMQYTDDLLAHTASAIGDSISGISSQNESLIMTLQNCYDVLNQNRSELRPTLAQDDGYAPVQDDGFAADLPDDFEVTVSDEDPR